MQALAKDLTKEEPRPRTDSLGGHQWLPRMIDKARATYAGTNGDYTHPCGGDKKLLEHFGITAEDFKPVIGTAKNDEEVVEGLRKLGVAMEDDPGFVPYEL